jgi:osmoprotectant transport system substrate-binding protein
MVIALVLAGCAEDDDGGPSATAFEGVSITVGSKDFTEQYVLSEILIQALEARGAEVTDTTDTGDTPTTRAALLNGDIDAYFEYNSTGWVQHLGNSDPSTDGEELTEAVREADADNGILWIGRSDFNNTYGFAVTPSIRQENLASRSNNAQAFDLQSMADWMEDNPDTIICVEPEFPARDDGLVLFEEATGFDVPDDRIRIFEDNSQIHEAVADGDCDFGEVFTTDGQLDALELTTVIDPGVFYVYNVSLNIRRDVYEQAPEAFDELVEDIITPLSQVRITQLNERVAFEGDPVELVAEDYLEQFEINP